MNGIHFVRKSLHSFAIIIIAMSLLGGCADMKSMFDITYEKPDLEFPANDLIIKGMEDYNVGKYFGAISYFQEILEKYPFSPEAPLAELKAADCNYYMDKYPEALAQYQDFEDRHPTNEAIPYVMYQKGMSNYKQIDRIDRDPIVARRAVDFFSQLLRAFPNSPYTTNARKNIAEAISFLADHEFAVIEFYLRTEKYEQAETRLEYLITAYPNTNVIPKAEKILAEIQAGNPPRRPLFSWFPDFKLPDWTKVADDEDNTINTEPNR
ncbi:outer membrane protein assembly factor BamD [Desulfotalea psychrophila]|uniref:Outer membrane lipoprotein BamD-like domain-containing protein n=1 Tax=Desulfotalea psychrophila (strain LSv54 / DSM 12343) TaxID=177439 RepID=Q6AQ36_DESPS|nr:outer membrane protein assembly factor BamD [Desulfotalea psychrophila]CAG35537.1 hypothetical protein DP0808 [Desulfotalea psychrophila LSv54]